MALIPLPLEKLLRQLSRLPGLGPRSAQRVALSLLQQPNKLAELQRSLTEVAAQLAICECCGNLAFNASDSAPLCEVCKDPNREQGIVCVVEGVADVWALERSGEFRGVYMVLGGVVSALSGVGPEDIRMGPLVRRIKALVGEGRQVEVILALGASVDGQTTGHMIVERLNGLGVMVTSLAKGMPVGAAVDYMDEGTLSLALQGRQKVA